MTGPMLMRVPGTSGSFFQIASISGRSGLTVFAVPFTAYSVPSSARKITDPVPSLPSQRTTPLLTVSGHSPLGKSDFDSHQTVLTLSFARILRLFTHAIGDGNFAGLCQKNSSARKNPHSSQSRKRTHCHWLSGVHHEPEATVSKRALGHGMGAG